MSARSPYPDVEVPEICLPTFVLDRAGERGAAVPLMGPADHGSARPLMGPAVTGTTTPLLGPAVPATVTPLLGPADRGTMVSLLGPADPGTATPLMFPKQVMPRSDRRTDVSPGPGAVRQPDLGEPSPFRHRHGIPLTRK